MAKKGLGKLVAAATIAGAAAAGISYLKKYKSFNDELEEDFHDFEGSDEEDDLFEDEDEEKEDAVQEDDSDDSTADDNKASDERKYTALNISTDELKTAAKDMAAAAGVMAGAVRHVVKDAAAILGDTAQTARSKVAEKVENYKEQKNAMNPSDDESIFEDEAVSQAEDSQDMGFVPGKTAGTAGLDTSTPDSTLDVVKPEETPQTVPETEPTTVVEEID